MAIPTQGFTQLVENQVAAIQGVASALLDFTIGSVLRSVVEAVASVAIFLQAQALQVAQLTRLATSYGADADSFGADFDFPRLAATQSVGQLTFSRFTATAIAYVPVGTIAQTFDGSQQFQVIADTTNTAYNPAQLAYQLAAGVNSVTVAAQSIGTGTATNAAIGAVNVRISPVLDTVTNAAAFVGGANAESDAAYKARFPLYLASLSRATNAAVAYAISTVSGVSSYTLTENQNTAGQTQYGYFYVVVDDGSGMPSSAFINTVYTAINNYRPLGTYFNVIGPTVETANVIMSIASAAGSVHSAVVATAQAAVSAYISGLGLGASLPYSRLSQVAYDASPAITNVTGLTLNGGTSDLTATASQRIVPGAITVS